MAPSFEYKGVTHLHTESPWQSRTNRHYTTHGHCWGWIDGPFKDGGDYTWSDDPGSRFTSSDASDVVRFHNEWLKEQEPIAIQLVRACRSLQAAASNYRSAELRLTETSVALDDAKRLVNDLEFKQREQANQIVDANKMVAT